MQRQELVSEEGDGGGDAVEYARSVRKHKQVTDLQMIVIENGQTHRQRILDSSAVSSLTSGTQTQVNA